IMRSLLFAAALVVSLAAGLAHAQSPDDELIGLWSHEATFGPAVQGELAIRREGKAWQASLARLDARVEAKGEALSAVFPRGIGRFQGTLRADGQAIEGFWLRPAVTNDPRYPGGSSQAFATPLVLQRAGPDRWRGHVHPLPDPFRLYLKVFRNEDGMLLAAFRDPDQNRIGGASRFRAARAQDKVIFSQPNESGGYDDAFEATLLRQPDRLKLHWPELGRDIELQRRTPEQARDFFPRPPDEPAYKYKQPAQAGDGWQTARGRDVGIDEAALARAVQKIIDGDPAARAPSLVHSILVARRGKLVLEEYFFGFDRETPHDLRSAGKTFASVMLGAARLQGAKISPQTGVYELLAGRGPFANPDPRKAKITLAHLMTHTSGLACNDNDDNSPGNEDTLQNQTAQQDWWKYTLDLPMAHEPGERYAYCSANTNLMGAALTTATKTWLPEFFDRAVARPLGFGPYHWNLTPTDDGYLGGGAWLLPRDLLKVGQAYLDGGQWQGHRIVDRAWIAESTAPRIAISPATTGLSEEEFGNYYGRGEDAYAWHLGAIRSGERTYRTFEATGNGGQILIVAPELELVAVFTGGNYRQGGIWGRWRDQIIGAEIVAGMGK
ncbi:MAG TPA: serine hydrolase, partial [Lysobacter sp.]|nr:serine hydrolase [Lysobacter sp.]